MSTRKSSFFYGTLIALASLVSGMVIASRLDLSIVTYSPAGSPPNADLEACQRLEQG
jgi:hypothetical protein